AVRAVDRPWRVARAIGILINTRCLLAIVIASTGLELGLISPALYTIMMLMALVTTGLTPPILNLVYPRRLFSPSGLGAQDTEIPGFSILIPVSLPKSGAPLVQLADTLIGHQRENSRLYAVHLRKPTDHEAYRSGLDEAAQTHDQSLAPLLAQARGRPIPVGQV